MQSSSLVQCVLASQNVKFMRFSSKKFLFWFSYFLILNNFIISKPSQSWLKDNLISFFHLFITLHLSITWFSYTYTSFFIRFSYDFMCKFLDEFLLKIFFSVFFFFYFFLSKRDFLITYTLKYMLLMNKQDIVLIIFLIYF